MDFEVVDVYVRDVAAVVAVVFDVVGAVDFDEIADGIAGDVGVVVVLAVLNGHVVGYTRKPLQRTDISLRHVAVPPRCFAASFSDPGLQAHWLASYSHPGFDVLPPQHSSAYLVSQIWTFGLQ